MSGTLFSPWGPRRLPAAGRSWPWWSGGQFHPVLTAPEGPVLTPPPRFLEEPKAVSAAQLPALHPMVGMDPKPFLLQQRERTVGGKWGSQSIKA